MRDTEMTYGDRFANMKDFHKERDELSQGLIEMIRIRAEELTARGFSPEMAQFDCLSTLKIIVDELHGQFDVGNARQEWYREYLRCVRRDDQGA